MAPGFVLLYRSLLDSEQFQNPKHLQLFIWCLLKAGYKPSTWKGKKLRPGQFITGRNAAADELKASPSAVYRGLKSLEERYNCITLEANNQYTVVTVCNWKTYQKSNEYERTANEQPSEQRADNQRTTDEHILRRKEGKNEKRKEQKNPSSSKDADLSKSRNSGTGFLNRIDKEILGSTAALMAWLATSTNDDLPPDDYETQLRIIGVAVRATTTKGIKDAVKLFVAIVRDRDWGKISDDQRTEAKARYRIWKESHASPTFDVTKVPHSFGTEFGALPASETMNDSDTNAKLRQQRAKLAASKHGTASGTTVT